MRVLLAAAVAAALALPASAQFDGLSTTFDGSIVYFTSTLRIRGTNQPLHGKLFAADPRGVRLVESRGEIAPSAPPSPAACVIGELSNLAAAEVSGDGRILATRGYRSTSGFCYRARLDATILTRPSNETEYAGLLRLSAKGRLAVIDTSERVFSTPSLMFLDVQTGQLTPVPLHGQDADIGFATAGRTIADDGTAVFLLRDRLYIARPGGEVLSPVTGYPVAISANGSRIVYRDDALRVLDLRTGENRPVSLESVIPVGITDDGSRIAFLRQGQLAMWDYATADSTPITSDQDPILTAVLSGDGTVAYGATAGGRLVRISIPTGAVSVVIGRTPFASGALPADAGLFTTIYGRGLATGALDSPAPLADSLGQTSVWAGGRKLLLSRVSATSIDVLLPWDWDAGTKDLTIESTAADTPFEAPVTQLRVLSEPRAGAIAHQAWDGLVTAGSPPRSGEIVHVWAVGLGAVVPEVPQGFPTLAQPLPQLAEPLVCSNAEVLYAGLAPGYVARIYQIDLRLGTPGYQRIDCRTGNRMIGLTLNVLP